MISLKNYIFVIIASVCLFSCSNAKRDGFAVVIDKQSYSEAKTEIDGYLKTVEKRGLHPILVIDRWGIPDSIRAELIRLYNAKSNPIEGCVFIGDIPIAKVRDAQFLTSAFKMDQGGRNAMADYCVSTDRFYDSFDLEWDFIQQDTARKEYFYYSLRNDCSQKLRPTIYSARIFPRTNARGDKYEKLRRYMQRVNEADANNNPIDNVLSFGGHGNVSDSWEARMDEKIEMYDQMPWMRRQQKGIMYIDFRHDDFIKERLTTQLQIPELDYAVLHHHGSEEEQLLSGYPVTSSLPVDMDNARRYAHSQTRSYLNRGRTLAEAKKSIETYLRSPIPDEWVKEANNPDVIAADEAYSYAQDLHVAEFSNFHPQVRMVSLDACYNGSFHVDESIQEAYLFGQGNGTLIAIANTVNSIQDRWINRYLGMLGMGLRVGYVAVFNNTLENHVFGDPTFAFTPAADPGFDVNEAVKDHSSKFWTKQLDNPYPAVQVLSCYMLGQKCDGNWNSLLLDKFKTSPYGMVRLAALLELGENRSDELVECIKLGINDGNEMTQRFAVLLAGDCGDKSLAETLVRLYCENTQPDRVRFDLTSTTFRSFDSVSVVSAFERVFPEYTFYNNPDSVGNVIRRNLISTTTSMTSDFDEEVLSDKYSEKNRISNIRSMRNYPVHELVPVMLKYLSEPKEPAIQEAMWEALGWFELSYQAPLIAAKAKDVMDDERYDKAVRYQAQRAYNRLK